MTPTDTPTKNRSQAFINYAIARVQTDSAFRAVLKRADNPATEYLAWENLNPWCDLDRKTERKIYSTIAAALARAKPKQDGSLGIGQAIAKSYEDGNRSDAAKAKLRRLLACDSADEICGILRSLLGLIQSRNKPICYAQLLNDLLYFGDGEKIKTKWAINFYGRKNNDRLHA